MSLTIEVIKEGKHPLIERKEIEFILEHFGTGTPNRIEVKTKIAALNNSNESLTIIKDIKTHFGGAYAIGKAYIYENDKELEFYEPFHIRVRNLPKDVRGQIYQLKKKNEPYIHLFKQE